jgi:apolipoprotein D and lipocalin family protein
MITTLLLSLLLSGPVPNVDLKRYEGAWHEVARLPNRFQKDCVSDVTANYKLRSDGNIDVLNRCRTRDGRFIQATGLARRASKDQPNSVLRVRFAPAFLSFLPQVWGDYQVRALATDYSYAAVGSGDFKYLWIYGSSRGTQTCRPRPMWSSSKRCVCKATT